MKFSDLSSLGTQWKCEASWAAEKTKMLLGFFITHKDKV